ncbi:MAG: UTP--glucose-1-phosphate uridylyltransferase [Flavobacteriaceae bacterium]|nr:UTP--glucose-1-phosphate uridylyltransferase [Bacteroidia bacterium]NNF74984.1 UTP--glucose-1-phosphate uridylyltransferase [Flavobacteriaceae bacterium]NNK71714.1 UTP--glucose-1-phosphate uridylyltransferase [Flavobacteriaceae bacterium]
MAAGSGSRYGKLKQFDELGPKGEFLMEFSIYDAISQGFDHIVIITKAANQDFLKNYLRKRLPENIKIDVLVQDIHDIPEGIPIHTEREKPWGTAHAVWTARDVIKSDFVIINADDYYGKPAFEGAANFITNQESDSDYALVGYKLEDTLSDHGTVSRGICEANNGKLKSIEEVIKIHETEAGIIDEASGKRLSADALVSMNFWICNPSIFEYITGYFKNFLRDESNHEKSEIYIPFVAQEMMSQGLIDIEVIDARSDWFGVTYYDDKVMAVKTLKKLTEDNQYPSPLWTNE